MNGQRFPFRTHVRSDWPATTCHHFNIVLCILLSIDERLRIQIAFTVFTRERPIVISLVGSFARCRALARSSLESERGAIYRDEKSFSRIDSGSPPHAVKNSFLIHFPDGISRLLYSIHASSFHPRT